MPDFMGGYSNHKRQKDFSKLDVLILAVRQNPHMGLLYDNEITPFVRASMTEDVHETISGMDSVALYCIKEWGLNGLQEFIKEAIQKRPHFLGSEDKRAIKLMLEALEQMATFDYNLEL